MAASARLGDTHVCPIPGHGTSPITSSSLDTLINSLGAARVGDIAGCGAIITSGFPSIIINGRPLAYLGSPTDHGGTIFTGSADVLGGFRMGGSGLVVDFAKLGAISTNGQVDDNLIAALAVDPDLESKAKAADALINVDAHQKNQLTRSEEGPQTICNDPDSAVPIAEYMAGEMNQNLSSPAVKDMRELNTYNPFEAERKYRELPIYARLGPTPDFSSLALRNKAAAYTVWAKNVGQNTQWDHKPIISKRFGGVWQKYSDHDYYYDIWSNIHYGYIGMAAGFTESELLDGAGLEQIGSDTLRQGIGIFSGKKTPGPHRYTGAEGLRGWDDVNDQTSIALGIKLYKTQPNGGITAQLLLDEIEKIGSGWGEGYRAHQCCY